MYVSGAGNECLGQRVNYYFISGVLFFCFVGFFVCLYNLFFVSPVRPSLSALLVTSDSGQI